MKCKIFLLHTNIKIKQQNFKRVFKLRTKQLHFYQLFHEKRCEISV